MTTLKEYINKKGGQYIEEFDEIDGCGKKRYKVRYLCENGHECIKRKDAVKNNWCLKCLSNNISDAHKLAVDRGYKFMSNTYVNAHTIYSWECLKNGHKLDATYWSVRMGTGCQECLKIPYISYVDLIKNKGGKIITTAEEYVNAKTRFKFTCKEGHYCEMTGCNLRNDRWCAECQTLISERTCRRIFEYLFEELFPKTKAFTNPDTNYKLELDGYNEELKLAFEYQGIQHYQRVEAWQTEQGFQDQLIRDEHTKRLCEENGINLIIIPYTVKYEDLYSFIAEKFPENNFEKSIDYLVLDIKSKNLVVMDELRKIVDNHGGKLETKNYISNVTKMDVICKNGHKFQTTSSLLKRGNFCQQCNIHPISKKSIANIAEFCTNFNYELCSEYTKCTDIFQWKCTTCDTNFECSWTLMIRNKPHCAAL